jgi:hypothetical protein
VAAQLVASRVVFSSTELVSYDNYVGLPDIVCCMNKISDKLILGMGQVNSPVAVPDISRSPSYWRLPKTTKTLMPRSKCQSEH